eukprot:scaffold645_cov247-Pinguiococcus_pyrenoidosus.AAC.27
MSITAPQGPLLDLGDDAPAQVEEPAPAPLEEAAVTDVPAEATQEPTEEMQHGSAPEMVDEDLETDEVAPQTAGGAAEEEEEGEEDPSESVSSSAENVIPPPVRNGLRSAQQLWLLGFNRAKELGAAGVQAVQESQAYNAVKTKLQEANDSEAMGKIKAGAASGWNTVKSTSASAYEASRPTLEKVKTTTVGAVEAARPHLERVGRTTVEVAQKGLETAAGATKKGFDVVKETVTGGKPGDGENGGAGSGPGQAGGSQTV